MDITSVIQQMGGGMPAVVIAFLGWFAWAERRRNSELTDRMLDREKQHSAELIDTIRVIDTAARVVEDRR